MRNLKLQKWWKVKNIIIVIWGVNIIKNTNSNRILNLINRMFNFTTNMNADDMKLEEKCYPSFITCDKT
jgi:hypothetical protein